VSDCTTGFTWAASRPLRVPFLNRRDGRNDEGSFRKAKHFFATPRCVVNSVERPNSLSVGSKCKSVSRISTAFSRHGGASVHDHGQQMEARSIGTRRFRRSLGLCSAMARTGPGTCATRKASWRDSGS
jgi:hypothetical protein